jgi:hypothetical protein
MKGKTEARCWHGCVLRLPPAIRSYMTALWGPTSACSTMDGFSLRTSRPRRQAISRTDGEADSDVVEKQKPEPGKDPNDVSYLSGIDVIERSLPVPLADVDCHDPPVARSDCEDGLVAWSLC